jgi:hypothetical protein
MFATTALRLRLAFILAVQSDGRAAVGEAVLSRQSSQVRASQIRNSRFSRTEVLDHRVKRAAISARRDSKMAPK